MSNVIQLGINKELENLQHINQIQYLTICNLQEKMLQLESKMTHLELLLRFNPIILKGGVNDSVSNID
jgi:hypothetical protein